MLIGHVLWVLLFIGSSSHVFSNSRLTHSEGPADMESPPCTRRRKDANMEDASAESRINKIQHQADGHSQLEDAVEWASPFARPSPRAGASTVPTSKYFYASDCE